MKLFCLAHAGGSEYNYYPLKQHLADFDFHFMDLPGHGKKMGDALLCNFQEALDYQFKELKSKINNNEPYAMFGHSIGCLIGFELIRMCQKYNLRTPECFLASGHASPNTVSRHKEVSQLTSTEFLEYVKSLGGISDDISIDNPVLNLFEPILRADFNISSEYIYHTYDALDCKIVLINGKDDKMVTDHLHDWRKESLHPVKNIIMDGGHFYLYKNWAVLADVIRKNSLKNE